MTNTPRPLSLLFFTLSAARAGVEEHILTLLRGLDRTRFRPHLACPAAILDALRPDLPPDVGVLPVSPFTDGWFRTCGRLVRYLRREQIDILHAHMSRSSQIASPLAWLCRVPVIVETSHGREAWRSGIVKGSFLPDRIVARMVDAIIAVSQANARFLIEAKGVPADKVNVVWNGCDLRQFSPGRVPPPELRQSLGLNENDPVLLAVARLEPQKGHHVLIDAMPRVLAEFPGACLICLGEGALRTAVESQARDLNVLRRVRFPGFHSNVQDWLALADISVLPSFFEGLPLVAIESLASGVPMVASAVDGTPEVVVDGQGGFTVPPGDPARLAEAICRLLRDPDLRHRMGLSGRAHVLTNFSKEQQVRGTEELYLGIWRRYLIGRGVRGRLADCSQNVV